MGKDSWYLLPHQDQEGAKIADFHNHIVLYLLASEDCLVNWIMPLRTRNFHYRDLEDIVIFGESVYRLWLLLASLQGSAVFRAYLSAVNVNHCAMCGILSAGSRMLVDQTLVDKESILTTLNIKGMFGKHLHRQLKSFGCE